VARPNNMIKLVNILREGKSVSIFDFDDTLVNSLSWIYVKKGGKEIKKLDAAQFAIYSPKKGEEFDFRDFDRKIRNPKLIKKNADLLRKQLKKHGRKVTILTARRIGLPVSSYLRSVGIDAYVVPLGSSDPKKKADYIEKEIKKGYNPVYFMDDSPKNIKAVDALKKKYPKVNLVTKLVKHGY
jgi:predicted Fe-Mo cluster-binding NifX family protein